MTSKLKQPGRVEGSGGGEAPWGEQSPAADSRESARAAMAVHQVGIRPDGEGSQNPIKAPSFDSRRLSVDVMGAAYWARVTHPEYNLLRKIHCPSNN